MTYVMLLVIFLLDALSIFFCYVLIRELLTLGNTAPFVPTRAAAVEEIVDAFGQIPPGSIVYDLGCGEGRMLRALADKNPQSMFKGFDIRWFPYTLAKRRSRGRQNILYELGDFYAKDLSAATHVYTYLYPNVMIKLEPKLKKELKPGTMLYSLDFTFKDMQPIKTVALTAPSARSLAKALYVYQF